MNKSQVLSYAKSGDNTNLKLNSRKSFDKKILNEKKL